ncbi:GGDEF domain-containing protein [Neobacillus mesonae]|uniref:GGDEF domain-containing protein n=1 Tax=Neobacillus mesonae TaxID=1193713 RepID=UPI00203BF46F|nr:GGDEF domain-containing protein [Neobacillus mesonae]MCM3570121.1 GGDEF domain-containing protein [Neobacillus mesonae]
MKMTGRIITFALVLCINTFYILFYYHRDGFVSWLEIIGLPIMVSLAWFFGKQYDRAKYFSEKDTLTEVYNRRIIEPFFQKITAISDRNKQKVAILLVDVDNFKTINDQLGHQKGDELLKFLAKTLQESVRKSDIVARWGGDEFILFCSNIKNSENLEEIIGRIHSRLKNNPVPGNELNISIGTSIYPNEGTNLDALLRMADKKMYNMKIKHLAE